MGPPNWPLPPSLLHVALVVDASYRYAAARQWHHNLVRLPAAGIACGCQREGKEGILMLLSHVLSSRFLFFHTVVYVFTLGRGDLSPAARITRVQARRLKKGFLYVLRLDLLAA